MDLKNKVFRLPDYYDKSDNSGGRASNNWKILELSSMAKRDFKETLDDIRIGSDFLTAEGAQLDIWGSIYGLTRDGDADDVFRFRIQIAQLKDKIEVDYSSWYGTMLQIFQCGSNELEIVSTGEPFEYRFLKFPYTRCNEIGLDVERAEQLMLECMPVTGRFETIQINYWANIAGYIWNYAGAYTWDDVLHSGAFRT